MTTTTPKILAISSVRPAVVPKGFVEVTASTRATKDKETGKQKEIAPDQRSRSLLMPELTPNVSSKYVFLVAAALHTAAEQQLRAQWTNDPQIKETDAALYTEDALLLFAAREAENKKLNGEQIAAWFKTSELFADWSAKYKPAQIAKFQKEIEHLAAPSLSSDIYNEEKARKRIVTLATFENDAAHEVCQALILKLQRYIERTVKAREELGSVEEIPE